MRVLSDLASSTVTAVVPIAVTPINDPPVIQLPFATIRMDENAAAYVGDVAMKSYIHRSPSSSSSLAVRGPSGSPRRLSDSIVNSLIDCSLFDWRDHGSEEDSMDP